jgi:hypothetical protein
MHATKQLPTSYHIKKTLDFSGPRAAVWLNLAAIPLLFIFGWFFSRIVYYLRSINPSSIGFWSLLNAFSGLGVIALILSLIFMLTFHELIHGAFFWIFTSEQPKFALRPGYAYASSPEWCLPRWQYIIVGLSPLVIISLLSILFAIFLASSIVPYLIYIATFNAAGALGDMIVVVWVLRQAPSIFVQDQGDKFISFAPDSE